ncbi:hypothetical protein ACFW1A_09155 [Kitasatospora sp. NPDC058965]|uniref:hypothetical protein n=1 Tax=Kitasatospora sp. NPDC058965 TaxID=3346682 RepID=UPI0036987FD8
MKEPDFYGGNPHEDARDEKCQANLPTTVKEPQTPDTSGFGKPAHRCGQFQRYNGHGCVSDIPQPDGFGDGPDCANCGSEMCRGADDPPINEPGSLKPTRNDYLVWLELSVAATLATGDGYVMSSLLLGHYLTGGGATLELSADAIDKLYENVPAVHEQIDETIRGGMKASLAEGNPVFVSPWQIGDADEVGMSKNPLTDSDHAFSPRDWFTSFADFDYRVAATRTASGAMEFRFQVRKYYDFDKGFQMPGRTFSASDLIRLHDTGLAQNYWIFAQSSMQTVP